MSNSTVILLDLEDTIIKHWTTPYLINVDAIEEFVQSVYKYGECTFGIYSYALWCNENIRILQDRILPLIEQALDVAFDETYIFHMNDIVSDFVAKNGPIDYGTYCTLINKEKSILDFHVGNPLFEDRSIILIDDTVTHGLLMNYPHMTINFVNPNNL